MIGMTLQNALHKIIEENPTTTFLVNGDTLRGDIREYKCPSSAKFIFVRDCIAVQTADLSTLKELSDIGSSEIVLVQYDCYISQIWQLTMQACVEQLGISHSIKRICFYEDKDSFRVRSFDNISVVGSYAAYCQFVFCHEPADLSKYLITAEAVECYLDINSTTGPLRKYICETSAQYDNPYLAYGSFLRDFPAWGLSEDEFLMIAIQTLATNTQQAETVKKWKRMLKK